MKFQCEECKGEEFTPPSQAFAVQVFSVFWVVSTFALVMVFLPEGVTKLRSEALAVGLRILGPIAALCGIFWLLLGLFIATVVPKITVRCVKCGKRYPFS